jgi:hypothetical protein
VPSTTGFIATINKELPDVAVLFLVTITAGATTIRLVRNYEPVTSNGEVFTPYPHMEVGRADDAEDRPPARTIVLEDVDRSVLAELRALDPDEPPEITIQMVMSDALDAVVDEWTGHIREASYDATSIEAEITTDQIIGVGFPKVTRTPATHPALFADD